MSSLGADEFKRFLRPAIKKVFDDLVVAVLKYSGFERTKAEKLFMEEIIRIKTTKFMFEFNPANSPVDEYVSFIDRWALAILDSKALDNTL